ncbi:MAG: Chromosome partition protein Smc, partial [Alphaproteobacteria bacterium MarineAlpha9_Bin2]
ESEENKLVGKEVLKKEVTKLEKLHELKNSQLNSALSLYHQSLNEINNRKNKHASLLEELKRHEEQINNITKRILYLGESKEKSINDIADLKEKPTILKKRKQELLKKIRSVVFEKDQALNELQSKENLCQEINNNYVNSNELVTEAREEKARQEGLHEQAQQQIENINERIKEKLNIEPEDLVKIANIATSDPSSLGEIENKLEKYILKRERMGPVNLVAEKDASELESKVKETENERDDLTTAINKLRGSIGSINRESRNRLMKALNSVNEHFKKLFTKLFGGGEAFLKLEGSDDPLEAGLELMASPPGKKLQQLDLLSGGEKAITALALIFSVFLTKPSPLCILDEVDAPLDDSNVDRFCDVIDEITQKSKTRFLIVTHHRLTMARMDRLYGVTMNEPGVSQLVSVSLKEAESIKAAE